MRSHTLLCFLFFVLVCSVSASAIAVSVSSPANNSNVTSPVNINASATPTPGYVITGWHIYADGVDSYSSGAVNAINTNLTIANGTHTVVVRAWDSSGAFASQTLTLNFVAQGVTVSVSSPLNGATAYSPAHINANAISANPITGWHVYVDSVDSFSGGAGSTLSADVLMSVGSHTVIVRAWDSTGALGSQTFSLTVASPGVGVAVSSPANNATVASPATIQASATSPNTIIAWHVYVDNVDSFSAGQTNSISASLALSPGTHTVIVRAWDSTGAYNSQSLTLTATNVVQVTLTTPANNSSVSSPVALQASATSGNGIVGWHVYVDSVDSYTAGAVSSINPSLVMANGPHTIVVRAWDSGGASGDKTITVNVLQPGVNVVVSTPANNSTVSSPVTIQASATSTNAIVGWHIYLDSADVFSQSNISAINTSVNVGSGSHTLVVRAWDSSGSFGDQTLTFSVGGTPPPPGGNYTLIDDINPWLQCLNGCGDPGGTGPQPVTSQSLVASPNNSADGFSHLFSIGGTAVYADSYWYVNRTATSTPAMPSALVTQQTYSFDLLIPSGQENNPQAIEWETQQQFQGTVYNTGWQALYAGISDPTKMQMRTFQWSDKTWYDTGILVPRFTADAWHHVQVDEHVSGTTIFFDDIIIDQTRYVPTIPSGASHQAIFTGFSAAFNNAFQLDLNFRADPYTVYIDNMTITYSTN
ncbi:MAG TPA: hypothetical protein VK738_15825 [Terriglobales bacterium]|nr:hypothetical protein [Terriglobales bacterium]